MRGWATGCGAGADRCAGSACCVATGCATFRGAGSGCGPAAGCRGATGSAGRRLEQPAVRTEVVGRRRGLRACHRHLLGRADRLGHRIGARTSRGASGAAARPSAAGRGSRLGRGANRDRRGGDLLGRLVDAGGHDRHADDAFQFLVEGRAQDDVGVLVDLLADAGRGLVNLEQGQVAAAGDRDQQALGALHRGLVEQRIGRSRPRRPPWRGPRPKLRRYPSSPCPSRA